MESTLNERMALLPAKIVETRLGLKPGTLGRWRRLDIGPPYVRLSPRQIRYDWVKVQAWLDAGGMPKPQSSKGEMPGGTTGGKP